MAKVRLDILLVQRGLAQTRAKAQAAIQAGGVTVGGAVVDRASALVGEDAALTLEPPHPWVSRGGVKLAHALDTFGEDPRGRACLDVGASTGGFTDVLLARGAARVHAVDVGHGQLAWKLRTDPRVVVHERLNARFLTRAHVPEEVGALTCDASFIGLRTVLPAGFALCAKGAWAVALIKPQFEAGPGKVGKRGVVSDPAVHAEVQRTIAAWWAEQPGWRVLGVVESPLHGPEGNREFLIAARHVG